MRALGYQRYRATGTAMAEFPVMLWFLLVIILFPMINLSTVCLRSYFLYQACHNAAVAASKATSFETSFAPNVSSKDSANQIATEIAAKWSGVHLTSVTTQLVTTDINTLVETVSNTRLALPPNVAANNYHVRVTVTGTVDPLLIFNLGILGGIPGLTSPIALTMNDQNFVENTQGLVR